MASASASFGIPDFASYSAAKFFVRGPTEALDLKWKRHDIFVCDISPPLVDTAMVRRASSPIIENMGVNLLPDDVAKTIWKAAHGRRVHWPTGTQYEMLEFVLALAPYAVKRKVMSSISGYS